MNTHPLRNSALVVGAVFVVAFGLAALIGQRNDGPLGGLPVWLGTAAYVVWFVSGAILLSLGVLAVLARLRQAELSRRGSSPHGSRSRSPSRAREGW